MRRGSIVVFVIELWLCCSTAMASPVTIVDTGIGMQAGYSFEGEGLPGGGFQNGFAALIKLTESYIITDVYSVISTTVYSGIASGGEVTSAVYEGVGETPATATELYNDTFDMAAKLEPTWRGLSNLSWELREGYYWFSFEIRGATNTFNGRLWGKGTPNPVGEEAYSRNYNWIAQDPLDMTLQIIGETKFAPVPVPSTIILLGTGLLGLAWASRKKFKEK